MITVITYCACLFFFFFAVHASVLVLSDVFLFPPFFVRLSVSLLLLLQGSRIGLVGLPNKHRIYSDMLFIKFRYLDVRADIRTDKSHLNKQAVVELYFQSISALPPVPADLSSPFVSSV